MRSQYQTLWLGMTMSLLAAFGCMSTPVFAEDVGKGSSSEDLIVIAQQAKQQFLPLAPDRLAKSRQRLLDAIDRLDAFLGLVSPEEQAAWKGYLDWQEMMGALKDEQKLDLARLQSVTGRYFRNEDGLELEPFTSVRDALVDLISAVHLVSDKDLKATYIGKVDRILSNLKAYQHRPTVQIGQQIGQTVGWLEQAGQASTLVTAIRHNYWQSNLTAQVSERLAARGVQEPVNRERDVSDCILGTSITGHATMDGQTDLRFDDNVNGQASITLLLTGRVHSVNVGRNRGVTLHSQGTTTVDAEKQFHLSAEGIVAWGAIARCCTSSTITGICAPSGLIRHIAQKRAARSKGQAERIASRHAEQQIAQQMDNQAEEMLHKVREAYQGKFRLPLIRRGEFPQEMSLQTAAKTLRVRWRQANPFQLAAPTPAPACEPESDLAVRVHESFVVNFSRALIGGFTLTDKRIVKIIEDSSGKVPDELKIDGDKEPWSITFSPVQPVSAVFSGNTLRFAIRGRRFRLGDRVIRKRIEMSAVYKLEKTPTGARLTRQGDVSVEYLGVRGNLGAKNVARRAIMRRKFEAIFAKQFITDGIKLPGRWEKAGKLHLQRLVSAKGWLSLDWIIPKNQEPQVAQRN